MMQTILAAMLFVSSVGEVDRLSLPITRWSSDAAAPANPTAISSEDWSPNQDFELLTHGRDEYVIADIRTIKLRPFELWKMRLNHHRLGFRVLGYEPRSGVWQELELRAAPLIGLVATANDLQAFDFIGFKNDGSGPGVLTFQTSSVSSVVDDVELFSGLYQFLLGFLFLLCPSSVILGVVTRRWEFIWYFLFLLGAWLMAVDLVPGNPTLLSFLPDGASSLTHGFVLYGVGFMGLLKGSYLLARFPRFQKLARYSLYTLLGCAVGFGFEAYVASGFVWGLVAALWTFGLLPLIVSRMSKVDSWSIVWLSLAFAMHVLGIAFETYDNQSGGLSPMLTVVSLLATVILHHGLFCIFVLQSLATQRQLIRETRKNVAEQHQRLAARRTALDTATKRLLSERESRVGLLRDRDQANARLDTELANLRLSFERMIETKRYATLGGFWPEFSRALSGGIDRLMTCRIDLTDRLKESEYDDLIERMDTALSSCRVMSEAVEGALEFDTTRRTHLQRVIPMAMTLLGWDKEESHLIVRIENDVVLPGAHAEWLQLVMNLLANSRNAMSSTLSMEGRGRVVLSARIVEDMVEIVIEDSGPGWPPELLRLCLTDLVDESPRHSGLGLLICARTCKRYGGTMTLMKSALGGAAAVLKVPNPVTSAAVH